MHSDIDTIERIEILRDLRLELDAGWHQSLARRLRYT